MPNYTSFSVNDQTKFVLPFFCTVGLSQYNKIAPHLGLGILNPLTIRDVSRQYASRTYKLFKNVAIIEDNSNTNNQDPYDGIWIDTIHKLQQLNEYDNVLTAINILKRDDEKYRQRVLEPEWVSILFSWINGWDDYPMPNMSTDTIEELQHVFLEGLKGKMRVQKRVPGKIIETDALDDWDLYILDEQRRSTWINLRAMLHRTIIMWLNVFNVLSIDQIRTLDEWGLMVMEGDKRYWSLYDLYEDFKDDGVLDT